jgi:hypothetical protein
LRRSPSIEQLRFKIGDPPILEAAVGAGGLEALFHELGNPVPDMTNLSQFSQSR